jgi:hypothetical protein
VPFYLAADRDVHSVPAPGAVACRCCPGGISRSSRARRYPSDMTETEWAVCEPSLPRPAWLARRGGRAHPAADCGDHRFPVGERLGDGGAARPRI